MGVKRELFRGGGAAFILNSIGKVLALIAQLVLARWLGAEGYGILCYALNITAILSLLSQAGLNILTIRQVAVFVQTQQWSELSGILYISNHIAWGISLTVVVISELILLGLTPRVEPHLLHALQLSLLIVPLIVTSQLRQQALRGFKAIAYHRLPETIVMPVFIVVGATILAYYGSGLSSAIVLQILSAFIGLLVGTYLLKKVLPAAVKTASAKYNIQATLRSSLPLFLASSSLLILNKLDVLFLGYFTTMVDVGVYSAVMRLAMLATFGMVALDSIVGPIIAEAYSKGDKQQLSKVASSASLGSTLFATGIGLIYFFWGSEILQLFGTKFSSGVTVLWILFVGQLVNSIVGPAALMLNMTGNERVFSRILLYTTLIGVCLHVLLIPRLGIIGAALSTALSITIWNVWATIAVESLLGIYPSFICQLFQARKSSTGK